jgi:hypothetical protein
MRLLVLSLSFTVACASGTAAGPGSDATGSETLRSTGMFIRACVDQTSWATAFAASAGRKPKVQLSKLQNNSGLSADTDAMFTAIERAIMQGSTAEVLPWGDALAGMASYQSDAMALGGGEASVTTDPDFIVAGTIERVADGGTATILRLLNNEGQPVCDGAAAAGK